MLIAEAKRAARNARHNLRWIKRNPDKIDPSKRADMEAYLQRMIRFAREEKKNARRAGRTSVRMRLVNILVFILPHFLRKREG
mgnify:CR=1 FL=1|jgi:hypothetical protein